MVVRKKVILPLQFNRLPQQQLTNDLFTDTDLFSLTTSSHILYQDEELKNNYACPIRLMPFGTERVSNYTEKPNDHASRTN